MITGSNRANPAFIISARLLMTAVVAIGALFVIHTPVFSQVLTVEPGCGKVGDSFQIGGSGWAEPDPVCEYIFFFDGTELPPRQPDGLFGPPAQTRTVPSVSAGEYDVKVELRLNSDGTLIQCRKTKFKVVDEIKDPWDGGITTPGGTGIDLDFDPTDVCDITPCTKIVFIQTVQNVGEKADGSTRFLTYTEQGFPSPATRDADLTATGTTIDYLIGESDPYYNGDDAQDGGTQGLQNGTPKAGKMQDGPNMPDSAYPPDIVKIIWNFEVAAFCAAGQNKGEFLGSMTWTWQRPKGGAITVTASSGSRNAPSQNFTDALTKWNTNHGFTLPTVQPPTSGGEACN